MNTKMVAIYVAAFALLGLAATPASAAQWVKLGERKVDKQADHDVLEIGGEEGKFKAIKFEVHDADVDIHKVRIVYGNGEDEVLEVKHHIKEGHESPQIDLAGHERIIKKIIFDYKTEAGEAHRARVVVLGHH